MFTVWPILLDSKAHLLGQKSAHDIFSKSATNLAKSAQFLKEYFLRNVQDDFPLHFHYIFANQFYEFLAKEIKEIKDIQIIQNITV